MPGPITLTKIEAARRQLRSAIELWFADGDPISILTLAAAAHQIIHDLNRLNKGPDMLFDSLLIKNEFREEFVAKMKEPANFLKHANNRGKKGLAKTFEFNPDLNAGFISFSIFGLRYLGEQLRAEEIAFGWWLSIKNPHLLTDAGRAWLEQVITPKNLTTFQGVSKPEFFKRIMQLIPIDSPKERHELQ